MVSNAAEFFALAKLKKSKVDVDGQTVHVREMSVAERAEFARIYDKDPGMGAVWLVQTCAITPDGKPLFTEKDAKALAEAAPGIVDKVAGAVMDASRLTGADDTKD